MGFYFIVTLIVTFILMLMDHPIGVKILPMGVFCAIALIVIVIQQINSNRYYRVRKVTHRVIKDEQTDNSTTKK